MSAGLPTRRLGKTDIQVSYPALGCGALTGAGNDTDAVKIVHRAIELGVNYLDTAPLYGVGESERITGLALSGGFREKVTLATKCGDPMPDYVKGQKPYSRQGLLNSVEHSLKLLNTKTIDVLLIHDPYKDELEQAMAPGGLMEGMRELKQQGEWSHQPERQATNDSTAKCSRSKKPGRDTTLNDDVDTQCHCAVCQCVCRYREASGHGCARERAAQDLYGGA